MSVDGATRTRWVGTPMEIVDEGTRRRVTWPTRRGDHNGVADAIVAEVRAVNNA